MDSNDNGSSLDMRRFITISAATGLATCAVAIVTARWFLRNDGGSDGGVSLLAIVGVLFGVILLVGLGGLALVSRSLNSTIGGITLAPQPEFVMPHRIGGGELPAMRRFADPVESVDALESLGFARVGAYRADLPDHSAVFACLLAPDAQTMATVTPAHTTLASVFDGKVFSTSGENAGAPRPEWNLGQVAPSSEPDAIWAAHRAGLTEIARLGAHPMTVPLATALDTTVAIDRAAIRDFTPSNNVTSLGKALVMPRANSMLGTGPKASARIREWLSSTRRWD